MRIENKTKKEQIMKKSAKCKWCKCSLDNGNVEYNTGYEEYCYDCGEELHVMKHQFLEEMGIKGVA
mgnify:CR=1 FL=1